MCRTCPTLFAVCALCFGALSVGAQDAEPARGAEILAPFKQNLMQTLRAGLEQGAVDAIEVCQIQAPQIAGDLSHDGIRVGRTSHRLRNPSNAIPTWVAPVLDAYEQNPEDLTPQTISIRPDLSGYVEPILVQPLCLSCHGEALEPPVASRLGELYPADRATGYKVGELRGVFWVEYPPAK